MSRREQHEDQMRAQVDAKLRKAADERGEQSDVAKKVANTSQETAQLFDGPQRSVPLVDHGDDRRSKEA